MQYQWNPQKRLSNLQKHGFDFEDAWQVLEFPHLRKDSPKQEEARFAAVGFINGREAVVVYTLRDDACRIISIRRARHNEREEYHQFFK